MKKYYEILKNCPLFEEIDENDLDRMLICLGAKTESFDKKYTIISEGSRARYIGILLSGTAQVIQLDYYGNRSILESIEPSQMFAEEFACAGITDIPVSIIADSPCEVMLIDCNHILKVCANGCGFHHKLIYNLMRALAQKNISFHRKIEITSKRSTREKLMTFLMLQAREKGNSFTVPFDRQELADYLEVDRSGLSAEISKLRSEGVLESRKNRFTLL